MLANEYLKQWTGKDGVYWLHRLGTLIGKHSKPIRADKRLATTNVLGWVSALTKEVMLQIKKTKKLALEMDENIYHSRCLSVIFTLWTARIIRAKCYDQRRPIRQRRRSLGKGGSRYLAAVASCLMDESLDPTLFPAQEWDNPFSLTARYEPDEMELARQQLGKKRKSPKSRS